MVFVFICYQSIRAVQTSHKLAPDARLERSEEDGYYFAIFNGDLEENYYSTDRPNVNYGVYYPVGIEVCSKIQKSIAI